MAVHAALNSLTQTLENLMQNDHLQLYDFPIPLINDHKGQQIIKSLHEKLSFLQSFLEENYHNIKETVDVDGSLFEARIRDFAHHVEDLIESHISDHVPSKHERFGLKKGFLRWSSTLQRAVLPQKKAKKYEHFHRVIEEIDLIVEESKKIKKSIDDDGNLPQIINTYSSRQLSRIGIDKMVGLDEDLLKIKNWLCGDSSSRLQAVSIVGMGGTGKTTLARNVFDDSLVAYHFDRRAWVTISQQYFLRELLIKILDSIIGKMEDLSEWGDEKLKECVYKSLKGRRYLIVMDDIWGTNAWDDFRRILPDDCNGSRILLTTRLEDVAVYVDDSSSHLHHVKFLDEDQSWNLLKEKVFAQESCPPELEIIGKKIVVKCGGLPLAIVLIAGLLSKAALKTQNGWKNFAEKVSSSLMADGDEHFSKIMALSYDHLPHHLKPCFLYIGGFSEDYEIPVFKLLQLWIAEGFVVRSPTIRSSKSLEEAAEEYLEDLVRRNLVLITKKSSIGKFRFCRIHDMLRDYCIQKAKDEDFFLHVYNRDLSQEEEIDNKTRRLFLFHNGTSEVLRKSTSSHVRSVIFSLGSFNETEFSSLAMESKLIRVLDGLETIPMGEVTKLFHLRYLSFSRLVLRNYVVPASIFRLRNLHTLILGSIHSFSLYSSFTYEKPPNIYLPDEIWKMPQLRHLILHSACYLPGPPITLKVGAKSKPVLLQNLQTLSKIVDFTFEEKCIEMIPNLKKLGVIYTDEWSSSTHWSAYHLHNLVHFHQLESLNLNMHSIGMNNFPMNFAFPQNLRKLALHGCWFPWEKMSVIGSLANLEVLKLRKFAFMGGEWVTVEGEFPRLKFLLMEDIVLRHWTVESSHFPNLERLIIRNCWGLEEIPSGIGDIPTLQLIEVGPHGDSVAVSAIRIQEEQQDMGNDFLQVRVIR